MSNKINKVSYEEKYFEPASFAPKEVSDYVFCIYNDDLYILQTWGHEDKLIRAAFKRAQIKVIAYAHLNDEGKTKLERDGSLVDQSLFKREYSRFGSDYSEPPALLGYHWFLKWNTFEDARVCVDIWMSSLYYTVSTHVPESNMRKICYATLVDESAKTVNQTEVIAKLVPPPAPEVIEGLNVDIDLEAPVFEEPVVVAKDVKVEAEVVAVDEPIVESIELGEVEIAETTDNKLEDQPLPDSAAEVKDGDDKTGDEVKDDAPENFGGGLGLQLDF